MNLYLITRRDSVGRDETAQFLVAAESPQQVRNLAVEYPGDEGAGTWASARYSTVHQIGEAKPGTKAGILLNDFNAG